MSAATRPAPAGSAGVRARHMYTHGGVADAPDGQQIRGGQPFWHSPARPAGVRGGVGWRLGCGGGCGRGLVAAALNRAVPGSPPTRFETSASSRTAGRSTTVGRPGPPTGSSGGPPRPACLGHVDPFTRPAPPGALSWSRTGASSMSMRTSASLSVRSCTTFQDLVTGEVYRCVGA
jgi:hypothetical protein